MKIKWENPKLTSLKVKETERVITTVTCSVNCGYKEVSDTLMTPSWIPKICPRCGADTDVRYENYAPTPGMS